MPSRWFDHFSDRTGGSAPSPATARREIGHFLRRLVTLLAALTALTLIGGAILSATEGTSLWRGINWSVDIISTTGSLGEPQTIVGELTKVVLITLGLGTLFYLLVYTAMTIGAFASVMLFKEGRDERVTLGKYAGLGVKRPGE